MKFPKKKTAAPRSANKPAPGKPVPPCPQLEPDMAQYLVNKTDETPTTGHQDRNNMGVTVNRLLEIVNWHKTYNPKPPEKGDGG